MTLVTPGTGGRAGARQAGGGAPAPARPGRSRLRRVPWRAYLYLLPALAVVAVLLLVPLGQAVQISLYRWDGLSPSTWAGFGDYLDLGRDPVLRSGFLHALVLIGFYAVIPVGVALVLAGAMTRAARLRGATVLRVLLFLPQVVATVVVATAWTAVYAPDGVLNSVLDAVGLHAVTRPWLGDFSTALPAVGLIGSWLELGLCLVLFLAGIGQIPRELYEAAKVDGAGAVREFFAVTLPGLRGQIAVALTLTVIAALKAFDLVYVATRGGPGNATAVPSYEIYDRAFNTGQVGDACALGVVMTLLILGVTVLIARLQPKEDDRA
ncbi:carbohydrate ABC transporter permease [Phaeacidiphilus oryzae]|uniref:carbohydrate ABC transporter permease n=1 Tax=Phaeacidiphilus oryzae TaxID=348818 RepID=UPI000564B2DB|nr:sugar ABC transporter permease [Phaeacidiphilus oryzae]